MMCVMGRWQETRPDKHPELAVEAALCHHAYDEIGLKEPNKAGEKHTTMVTPRPDKGTSTYLIVRCVTPRMVITRHNLAKTNERLVRSNAGQIKLDGAVFLNLTLGDSMSSQLVYVTPQVTCLFLSQRAFKELHAVYPNFPAQSA